MSRVSEIKHDLRVFPCLSGLKGEDIISIGQMANLKKIPKNHVVFLESDPVKFFFIVRNGAIKLYKTSQEGRELIVKIMGPGDYFCCAPLYASGGYYVSSMAIEDSTLIVIPADDFRGMLSSGISEMGLRIIAGLCARIRFLSNLVENLTFKDVEQRVIVALLRLAEEKFSEGNVVSLSLTHQDIASLTGTVREVVSRTMLKLKREGIIVARSTKGFKVDKERLLKLSIKKCPLKRIASAFPVACCGVSERI